MLIFRPVYKITMSSWAPRHMERKSECREQSPGNFCISRGTINCTIQFCITTICADNNCWKTSN